MTYRVPSVVLRSESTPQLTTYSNYTNLAAAAAVTSSEFLTDFAPIFDIIVNMNLAGSLQLQTRGAATGDGSTWRDTGNPYVIQAGVVFSRTDIRVPNARARWVLTNTGAVATTTLELFISNRSG